MKTRQDFEAAAAEVRALPMKQRRGKALQYAAGFKKTNPKFDLERFFAACIVDVPANLTNAYMQAFECEIDLRHVEFTIYYRWNNCDVDAALVPHLSNMCGRVQHEVGKADLLGGGYECGPAEKTPVADTIYALHDIGRKTKWPKGVKSCGGYGFIQGYSDMAFEYEGDLSRLQAVVEECKEILARMIQKHVRYHGKGDMIRNRLVNVYEGTGSGIHRVE